MRFRHASALRSALLFGAATLAPVAPVPPALAQTPDAPFRQIQINAGTKDAALGLPRPDGPGTAFLFGSAGYPDGTGLWYADANAGSLRQLVPPEPGPPTGKTLGTLVVSGGAAYYTAAFGAADGYVYRVTPQGVRTQVHRVQGMLGEPVPALGGVFVSSNTIMANQPMLWFVDGANLRQLSPIELRASGATRAYAAHGGRFYFAGGPTYSDTELWASDGTAAGTVRVKDIVAGTGGSSPMLLTSVGAKLFFRATTAAQGEELWVTDGTEAGTRLVKDLRPGTTGSTPAGLVALGDRLLFFADDGASGREVWTSDGTEAGTVRVKDAAPGAAGLNAQDGAVATASGRSVAVFQAYDAATGYELWASDGSDVARLADLNAGTASSNPAEFVAYGGRVYFKADDGTHGQELWVTDGTAAGTRLVTDLHPVPGVGGMQRGTAVAGPDRLWLVGDDGTHGSELWTSDGTAAGTRLVTDVNTAGVDGVDLLPEGAVAAGRAYFFGNDGVRGLELWSSDGTDAGTALVKDLTPGFGGTLGDFVGTSGPRAFFYTRIRPTAQTERYDLYATDGTDAGTVLLREGIGTTTDHFADAAALPGGRLALRCALSWLCVTTGEAGNLTALRSFQNGTWPAYLTPFKTGVVFAATDGGYPGVWFSDGTAAGTTRLRSIGTGTLGPQGFTVWGEHVYFRAYTASEGYELWKTDGTAAGTTLVKDLVPGSVGSTPGPFAALGGYLYFAATTPGTGHELWRTDGTAAGTTFVKDVNAGTAGSGPNSLRRVGDRLIFTATTPETGFELWTTDGTDAGTTLLYDVNPGAANAQIYTFASAGSHVVFVARDATSEELWQTDGTPEGTRIAADPSGDVASSAPKIIGVAGQTVFMSATNGTDGRELWVGTVGTPVAAAPDAEATEAALAVWPVPARGTLTLRLGSPSPGVATVRVFDLVGRERLALRPAVSAGRTTVSLGVDALPPGVYVVRAVLPGNAVKTTRLVVAR